MFKKTELWGKVLRGPFVPQQLPKPLPRQWASLNHTLSINQDTALTPVHPTDLS